jgi:phytoene dehydrogenase-like protein
VRLKFDNNSRTLRDEVAWAFSREADNFDRLTREIVAYDDLSDAHLGISAREVVSSIIHDPLLIEMLFCPLMFYGSAREHDMDWAQFSIMFRSIFLEGLGRPAAGVRLILKHLVRKFRALGGELRLRSSVKRLAIENGRVTRVVLNSDEELEARNVLSSAGWCETMRMCDDGQPVLASRSPGQLSFCETIATLDAPPSELGLSQTITFFNDHNKFVWSKPEALCDVRSGVICSPNNFAYQEPVADDGTIRVTTLANFDRWQSLSDEGYRLEKLRWYDHVTDSAIRFVPDFRGHVVDTDMFTPTTIVRYTGHDNGAVYGSPAKQLDGRTHVENLFICGTDQGFVGIIGSITSGIAMANRHCLKGGVTAT